MEIKLRTKEQRTESENHRPESSFRTAKNAQEENKQRLDAAPAMVVKNLSFAYGKNIAELPLQEFARKVAIVHQYNTAADDITVERLVAFGRTPHMKLLGGHSREDEEYIDWALRVTNMEKYRDREISKLSGGQRQRVWIAMALAQNTKILFLDEPTTYLDIRYQLDILQLVRKLNEQYGLTIIMVLHDINQAIHFSDRIIGLKDGKVGMEGPPGQVITSQSIYQLYGVKLPVVTIGGEKFVLTV